jgi:hypothetical protein
MAEEVATKIIMWLGYVIIGATAAYIIYSNLGIAAAITYLGAGIGSIQWEAIRANKK